MLRPTLDRRPAARRGFTLVELLVAAALSVVIMYILATAFKTGTDTLSSLKSLGSLADQARTAETVIGADLAAPHLEDENGHGVSVSRATALATPTSTPVPWTADPVRPRRGFFRIVQGQQLVVSPNDFANEGTDGDGIPSRRVTRDWLSFTVRLSGKSPQEAFTANIADFSNNVPYYLNALPGQSLKDLLPTGTNTVFVSRWAEVAYFLKPNSLSTAAVSPGSELPLYTLYRRVRLLVPNQRSQATATLGSPDGDPSDDATPAGSGLDFSFTTAFTQPWFDNLSYYITPPTGSPQEGRINSPESITDPSRRFCKGVYPGPTDFFSTPDPISASSTNAGSDILLSNVISMEVQTLTDNSPVFGLLPGVSASQSGAYDTASPTVDLTGSPPATANNRPRLRAVQIKLRVYDVKNQITRQVTIVSDL